MLISKSMSIMLIIRSFVEVFPSSSAFIIIDAVPIINTRDKIHIMICSHNGIDLNDSIIFVIILFLLNIAFKHKLKIIEFGFKRWKVRA